jgi:phytoene desaturase
MKKNSNKIISKKTQKTAIVIGAGFGGISLAIRLQSMGFKTVLLDNRDKPAVEHMFMKLMAINLMVAQL